MTDGGGYYTNNSSEYLTGQGHAFPYSMYNRVTRALSNSISKRKGGVFDRFKKLVSSSSSSSCSSKTPAYMLPNHQTFGLRPMMTFPGRLPVNVPILKI